jgi:hypothetical protein
MSPEGKGGLRGGLFAFIGLAGGFGLSFVGLGVLWIGTPRLYQLIVALPFLLLSWVVARFGGGPYPALPIIVGAAPIGGLITMFRDKDDSHLTSVLVVSAWAVAVLAGQWLGRRRDG